jgi:hypothetical protein
LQTCILAIRTTIVNSARNASNFISFVSGDYGSSLAHWLTVPELSNNFTIVSEKATEYDKVALALHIQESHLSNGPIASRRTARTHLAVLYCHNACTRLLRLLQAMLQLSGASPTVCKHMSLPFVRILKDKDCTACATLRSRMKKQRGLAPMIHRTLPTALSMSAKNHCYGEHIRSEKNWKMINKTIENQTEAISSQSTVKGRCLGILEFHWNGSMPTH